MTVSWKAILVSALDLALWIGSSFGRDPAVDLPLNEPAHSTMSPNGTFCLQAVNKERDQEGHRYRLLRDGIEAWNKEFPFCLDAALLDNDGVLVAYSCTPSRYVIRERKRASCHLVFLSPSGTELASREWVQSLPAMGAEWLPVIQGIMRIRKGELVLVQARERGPGYMNRPGSDCCGPVFSTPIWYLYRATDGVLVEEFNPMERFQKPSERCCLADLVAVRDTPLLALYWYSMDPAFEKKVPNDGHISIVDLTGKTVVMASILRAYDEWQFSPGPMRLMRPPTKTGPQHPISVSSSDPYRLKIRWNREGRVAEYELRKSESEWLVAKTRYFDDRG